MIQNQCRQNQFYIVQKFIYQNFQFGAKEALYYRIKNDYVQAVPSQAYFEFQKGGRVEFDTYFNALTIHKWKKYCNIPTLFFKIQGAGRFKVRFGVHQMGRDSRIIEEHVCEVIDGEALINIESWEVLSDGILYADIEAMSDAKLTLVSFVTDTKPSEDVKLGIVITHFNRKQWVLPAIDRLESELISDDKYKNKRLLAL